MLASPEPRHFSSREIRAFRYVGGAVCQPNTAPCPPSSWPSASA
nr:MAG TPA: hypothetical protein [Caudoviricetes sp.]